VVEFVITSAAVGQIVMLRVGNSALRASDFEADRFQMKRLCEFGSVEMPVCVMRRRTIPLPIIPSPMKPVVVVIV